MKPNAELINKGFNILLQELAPYLCVELIHAHGDHWWQTGVLDRLFDDQKKNLPKSGDSKDLIKSLDIYLCLVLLDITWRDIFSKKLPIDVRTWAKELVGFRNKNSHLGMDDFNNDDTWRALDTMARLMGRINAEKAEDIRSLVRKVLYGSDQGSIAAKTVAQPQTGQHGNPNVSGLLPWRDVISPHPDVAEGRYKNAEFAADLAQVARGEGELEYLDPVEFFNRTYITNGLHELLKDALNRVTRQGGNPVIQLKTPFGGGKTHSMLALYHLLRGHVPIDKIPALKSLLQEVKISELPKSHVAVLVGTAIDPSKSRRPTNLPRVTVNTLWGDLAAQIAISAGKPELYEYVREADKKGIAPGSEALTKLFDEAGSCLVLMDEIVAYARKIYGKTDLPAGSYENLLTFMQEISEAAKASKASVVVASLPESDIEIGGQAGQDAQKAIEHHFRRLEAISQPVSPQEGFEVVRRRLFLNCRDDAARDQVCQAFSDMYQANPSDFPVDAREVRYKERMRACYPIHPEVFDILFGTWATNENFQRTRGVLRLMAAVIHKLWMSNDQSLLIQPGSLPLYDAQARNELLRHLKDNWSAIVETEVDGENSIPFSQDKANPRYGQLQASRRVARAILFGSAPAVRQQYVRGVEAPSIRLGVVEPGEQIAVFNDALSALKNKLSYLYSEQGEKRYWYDTRPTLQKTAADRASQRSMADIEAEIESRLMKACRKTPPVTGAHICPANSMDVPDEQQARLVVLAPDQVWTEGDCPALEAANAILNNRGNSARTYKNMLVFLAPEKQKLQTLAQNVALYLAWKSIRDDRISLNLDASQNLETEDQLKKVSETVDGQLQDAWNCLLVPDQTKNELLWIHTRLSGKTENIVARAAHKLAQDEQIIEVWAPSLLLMQLDNLLWKDKEYIAIKDLWTWLTTYCYLPRLMDYETLKHTIETGVNSDQYFGYAEGLGENRFVDLKFNQPVSIAKSGYLVKKEVCEAQIAREQAEKASRVMPQPDKTGQVNETTGGFGGYGQKDSIPDDLVQQPVQEKLSLPTRFHLHTSLDNTRIIRDVNKIMEEVLANLGDSAVEIKLEVQAKAPEGYDQGVVQTTTENCRNLKIEQFGFEQE